MVKFKFLELIITNYHEKVVTKNDGNVVSFEICSFETVCLFNHFKNLIRERNILNIDDDIYGKVMFLELIMINYHEKVDMKNDGNVISFEISFLKLNIY